MKREILENIFEKHGVILAYLFGSQKEGGIAFLNGENPEAGDSSDLDIGVLFTKFPKTFSRRTVNFMPTFRFFSNHLPLILYSSTKQTPFSNMK